jgi:2-methylaconitate cis-trans-isomerase PrpF
MGMDLKFAFGRRIKDYLFYIVGSPDPDGRQIDGLGGGISSLSKVAVLSSPVEELSLAREYAHRLPAVNSTRDPREYDVVYRFAQVGVREPVVDWGSTCGNLVAAVAQVGVFHICRSFE